MFKKKWYQKALTPASTFVTMLITGGSIAAASLIYDGLDKREKDRTKAMKEEIRNTIEPLQEESCSMCEMIRRVNKRLDDDDAKCACHCKKSKD